MSILRDRWSRFGIGLLAFVASAAPLLGQGFVLPGLGPVNRSMAGAATAAPIDAIGALHWNPASISGLPASEMAFGAELLWPSTRLSSSIAAGALVPGVFPPVPLAGSTPDNNGTFLLPAFGLVYRPEGSRWTFGAGLYAIGGFGVNYPGDPGNPILSPRPPAGLGLGPLFSRLQVFQFAPTAAYQLTPTISIGVAPTVTMAELTLDPATFVPPDDANGNGLPSFPSATHSRLRWGGGFQAGIFFTPDIPWTFGVSIKSPQWLETFRWPAADELGRPRTLEFNLDYPLIVSLGTAYRGLDPFIFALDLRYLDFHNTAGLRASGFNSAGAIAGLGWDSAFSVAAGVQCQCTDGIQLRLGYSFNTNPIPSENTFFNVVSPTIYQHVISAGASYQISTSLKVSAAYVHAFGNSITGPIETPAGPLFSTSVTSHLSADALVLGASIQF